MNTDNGFSLSSHEHIKWTQRTISYLSPNIACPILTMFEPSEIAVSKSSLMPMERY
jgi:hypothetical protein